MSVFEHNVSCKEVAPLLVFYVCDEVSEKERKQIEAHLANCAACAAQVVEERQLQEVMIAGLQPADELDAAGVLLAQCRSERLDRRCLQQRCQREILSEDSFDFRQHAHRQQRVAANLEEIIGDSDWLDA